MNILIFSNFYKNTIKFFLSSLLMMGLIVWTIQAVNYFEFVSEDGHGIKVYFLYTLLNFPKIIHRLLPFMFFISLFYILISYEKRNELNIFWINGVSKIEFINKIIILSFFITIIQLLLASYLSPAFQFKARSYLKNSSLDFFTTLLKQGNFINVAKNMTIFIDKKNSNESFEDIFIEDNRESPKMIYAKKGKVISDEKGKKFRLIEGRIINTETSKTKIFDFDTIDLNLSNISSKTITTPKIQELKTILLFQCIANKNYQSDLLKCDERIMPDLVSELFKRLVKPFYIPLLALIAASLIITTKYKKNYNKIRNMIFFSAFFILMFSEASLKFVSPLNINSFIFFLFPLITFLTMYCIIKKIFKYV